MPHQEVKKIGFGKAVTIIKKAQQGMLSPFTQETEGQLSKLYSDYLAQDARISFESNRLVYNKEFLQASVDALLSVVENVRVRTMTRLDLNSRFDKVMECAINPETMNEELTSTLLDDEIFSVHEATAQEFVTMRNELVAMGHTPNSTFEVEDYGFNTTKQDILKGVPITHVFKNHLEAKSFMRKGFFNN